MGSSSRSPTRKPPALKPIYDDVFINGAHQVEALAGPSPDGINGVVSSDWAPTEDPAIDVRPRRVTRQAFGEPITFVFGYETRIELPLSGGRVRCPACGFRGVPKANGEMRTHACDASAVSRGHRVLRRLSGTRGEAIWRGTVALGAIVAARIAREALDAAAASLDESA